METTQKFSYKLMLDTNEVLEEADTNLKSNRPKLFKDSFQDDPPNYLYAKLAAERRRNMNNTNSGFANAD